MEPIMFALTLLGGIVIGLALAFLAILWISSGIGPRF